MQVKVAPSLLSADFLRLEEDVEMLNSSADLIHLDIMDGSFVPNLSFGFPVMEAVARKAVIPLDAHFMVVNPGDWVQRCAEIGISSMSFHLEAAGRKTRSILNSIRAHGMKAGLSINPDVPVEKLYPYIGSADFFLIMSVFAGFGGQKFIYESLDRIHSLKSRLKEKKDPALIEVDGGVNAGNAAALAEAGADILVAGNAVFKADNPQEVISQLRNPQ